MNQAENRRKVSSITLKLHFHQIWKNTGKYLWMDFWMYVAGVVCFLFGQEFHAGSLIAGVSRYFTLDETTREVVYMAVSAEGKELIAAPMGRILIGGGFVAVGLFGVQFLFMWIFYFKEDRKIRKILSPLDQLALKADELSRISFSEDKYQQLEEAIAKISPEGKETLSFGDSDLAGVETAMNNLLLRMRDTYRQQARFVNDASHELRTPIAVIQGYANMLDRWGKEDESILEEGITAIRHESDHMNHLVEQLLFLARGDSGRTTLNLEATDLKAMLQEIYEESFMIDERHPYRLKQYEGDLTVSADPGLLKQAVRILIDNAAKYTNEGDEILLSCGRNQEGEPYLQVQDSGIGMEEADVSHMFERFYRSDEVRSYDGTGLGLSIAKWIVDKHKGHFEILSRTGLGTRIRIVL